MASAAKMFVLDTNVLLHDHKCIDYFQDNDIVIPIVALEELDKFKKGNETINYHAREFARALDRLSGDGLFGTGISLGEGRGKLRIVTGKPFSQEMKLSFGEMSADHRILAIADWVRRENPERKVILVSKDINLRMKAKSLGIMAQDYLTDNVHDLEAIGRPLQHITGLSDVQVKAVYETPSHLTPSDLGLEAVANDCYILESEGSSALVIYNAMGGVFEPVERRKVYGIEPRNGEQQCALEYLLNPRIPLVALTGKAGTGKTLLALAAALAQEEAFELIMLARPIVPLSNRDLGFLPGDVDAKIGPYMQPLFDNLGVIKSTLKSTSRYFVRIEEMQRTNKLVISPLAYIRGRSLSHAYIIVDEAQNLTPHEVKTVITRAGEGTKIVFTGDIYQIDHPYLDTRSNGLSYLAERMHGQHAFAHINLVRGERSALAELASDLL
ncbi:MAG: PhoH family protein [Bacteroides sp.]